MAFTAPPIYFTFQKQIDAQIDTAKKTIDAKTEKARGQLKEQYDKGAKVAGGYVSKGLDKVGYKRNMPPVPVAASTETPAAAAST